MKVWVYDDECECQFCLDERHLMQISVLEVAIKEFQKQIPAGVERLSYQAIYQISDLLKERLSKRD